MRFNFGAFFRHRVTRLSLALLVLVSLISQLDSKGQILGSRVEAVGDLIITYLGLPLGDPVFEVIGFLPGDCETRTIDVENSGLTLSKVAVKSRNEIDPDNLSTQLPMVISENSLDLYGGTATSGAKTVNDFFTDSQSVNGVMLSTVGPGDDTSYEFEVCFNPSASNQYQNTSTIFDLVFGEITVPVELPPVCDDLEGIVTEVITGTPGDDRIRGTGASEFIRGLGGHDDIDGNGGHDCIISGPGNDVTEGGTGNDIITGNAGTDELEGGFDNDIIYGGPDADDIEGGSDDDVIFGGGGNDFMDGGFNDDLVYGGPGNDDLKGGSGDDEIYGQGGNDAIRGGSNDDYCDGGPGIDDLDGGSGTDTCINGEVLDSCELF